MASRPASHKLAEFLAALRPEGLPADTVQFAKLCLLDHFGCAIGGIDTEVGRAALRVARFGAGGPCAVVGGASRVAPETAALVNGTLAHALVFDDLNRQAKLHPGVAVIPAALAMAESAGAGGFTLLNGLVAGYEALSRIGMAIGMAEHRAAGWRATGTCGSFGAAAAAASVLGADAATMHDAIAFAAAQASGTWAFAENGGMELYLAAGTAARNGVTAAVLAHSGFHGAADPLQAPDGGFFTIGSTAPRPEWLTDELGTRLRLLDTCIKMYPTCHSTQTGIDAVLDLRARHGIGIDQVASIEVRAGEITRIQCGWPFEPGPPSRMIFHLGYASALALKHGKVLPTHFAGESLRDPDVVRIARETTVIADPELTAIYAQRKPCDVTLVLRDGRRLRERVDYCRGEPENPPTQASVIAKFRDLTGPLLSPPAADRVIETVMALDRLADLRPLEDALSAVAAPQGR